MRKGASFIFGRAICYELQAIGTSVYEYHTARGAWPQSAADLARTSLPARLRYWREGLESGRTVVAWPRNWKSNPKDNSTHVLAYYTAGLISEVGRNWVLWGDLSTEYLSKDRLKAALTAQAMK